MTIPVQVTAQVLLPLLLKPEGIQRLNNKAVDAGAANSLVYIASQMISDKEDQLSYLEEDSSEHQAVDNQIQALEESGGNVAFTPDNKDLRSDFITVVYKKATEELKNPGENNIIALAQDALRTNMAEILDRSSDNSYWQIQSLYAQFSASQNAIGRNT